MYMCQDQWRLLPLWSSRKAVLVIPWATVEQWNNYVESFDDDEDIGADGDKQSGTRNFAITKRTKKRCESDQNTFETLLQNVILQELLHHQSSQTYDGWRYPARAEHGHGRRRTWGSLSWWVLCVLLAWYETAQSGGQRWPSLWWRWRACECTQERNLMMTGFELLVGRQGQDAVVGW